MTQHDHKPRHKQNIPLGVVYGICAAFFFAMTSYFAKMAGEKAPVDVIIFARMAISLILILPWVVKKPRDLLKIAQPWPVIARSASTLLAVGATFYSLQLLPLTNSILLNNSYPLFVPIIFWLTDKIKTPLKVWMGILLGFIGIVLYLHPDPRVWGIGSLIAISGGVLAAFSVVLIRKMTKSISILQILFYNFLIGCIATGILIPFYWKPLDSDSLFLLLWVGVFGLFYQLTSTLCLAKAPARIGAPLMFLSILFGGVIDFFAWGHVPDGLNLIGTVCVILGGILAIYYGQKEFAPNPKADLK